MGWKKLIMGEKMPDKNDPQYKERYEKEVKAGQKVARWLKIDKAAAATQRFADRWPKAFLGIVFSIVIFCFVLNAYRLVQVSTRANEYQTAVEQQEKKYRSMRKHVKPIINQSKKTDNEHITAD